MVYDGSTLVHQPLSKGNLRPDDVRSNVAGNFYVASLVPQWEGNDVVFRVMVRNRQSDQFSPRPKQAWAEITPQDKESDQPFVFYDLEFENDTQVPVLRFRTPDWPAHMDTAHIKLWFQLNADDSQFQFNEPISKFQPNQRFSAGIDGIQLELEPQRVSTKTGQITYVVWEHYDASHRADMPLTKIQMAPTPDYTDHEYRRKDGEVRHLFRYHAGLSPMTVLRLQVTAKSRICNTSSTVSVTDPPLKAFLPPPQ